MSWNFQREETQFEVLAEGNYRIRVASAEKAQSKAGNDMLVLKFDVSGSNTNLFHYITFMKDKPEVTNRMLTQFFDSFKDIKEGDFNISGYVGKVGACHVKHEEYNGNKQAKLSYFIKAEKQGDLPPWQEPNNNNNASASTASTAPTDDDIPF